MDSALISKMQSKLKKWKEALAELNKKNNLLKFREDKKATIRILTSAEQIFQALVVEQKPLPVKDLQTQQQEAQRLDFLIKLRKNAKFVQQEKGVNSLFVALGTLTWSFKEDESDRLVSPILLIPVNLHKTKRSEFELRPTEEIVQINPILLQKLKADYGILVPEVEINQAIEYNQLFSELCQNPEIAEQVNWKIDKDSAFVGLFQRTKASMNKDLEYLEQNLERYLALKPSILWGLAEERTFYETELAEHLAKIPQAEELDDRVKPKTAFQVLEADSSQQVVIEAAKAGLSFVVQGPPGTGKSQTIANIIAELIGQDKKVLLVAQKPGALEVVFKRLAEDCKLEDLCLFFPQVSRKEFSKELEATKAKLNKWKQTKEENRFFIQLESVRQILNNHRIDLHKKWEPIDKSAFDLYGDLLVLEQQGVSTVDFHAKDFHRWSYEDLEKIKRLLEELALSDRFFRQEQKILWSFSKLNSFTLEGRARINSSLEDLNQGLKDAKRSSETVCRLLALATPTTRAELRNLHRQVNYVASTPATLPSQWSHSSSVDINTMRHLYQQLREDTNQFQEGYLTLQEKYQDNFLNLNLSKEAAKLRHYKRISRILQLGYWKCHHRIFSCLRVKKRLSYWQSLLFGYNALVSDIELAIDHLKLRDAFNSSEYSPRKVFYPFFDVRGRPNFEGIRESLKWIAGLPNQQLRRDKVGDILAESDSWQEILNQQENLWMAQIEIEKGFEFLRNHFFEVGKVITGSEIPLELVTFDELERFLERAKLELNSVRGWIKYQKCLEELKSLGLEQFVEKLKSSSSSEKDWYQSFEKGFYHQWLQHLYDQCPDLESFNAQLHEKRIAEFSEQDPQQHSIARDRLRQLHVERWREWSKQPSSKGQNAQLQRESQSKRPLEIRQVIKEMSEIVSILKPCWMMSPIAVSEYIEPEAIQFDTVIFDEASQIRTEAAISSIMRAKQIIVVGDGKQLPPTAFFSGTSSDDDDEEELDVNYESFLAACEGFMERYSLQWHYRSQDESLIDFSNQEFYGSELISFPNPAKDVDRGVHFHYVEGAIYGRGEKKPKNLREAEEVAKLAIEHRQQGWESLGIIAFSQAQADAIEEAIKNQLKLLPPEASELAEAFNDDSGNDSKKFFLKSLENVQGDERDLIILSFGYGKDKDGKLIYNFGPLTKPGGERRLNVAVTRATRKLILVASIRPEELESETGEIPRLRRYFEHTQQNDRSPDWNAEEVHSSSLLVEDICKALSAEGYEVRRSIGASEYPIDLGVINPQHPEEFLLGIECDGETYHRLATVRDRDRLRPKELEKRNWKLHRVWAKEWFTNREVELARLIQKIEESQTR